MTFPEKIEEWIKEVEDRPSSAAVIFKIIANRLRELAERNEQLLAENLALQDGSRVEEYQKRIAHLEYQLEMLKRRIGAAEAGLVETAAEQSPLSLLVYNSEGRIIRLEAGRESLPAMPATITGELSAGGELPRMLALPSHDELLLLFTSGRIASLPVGGIPALEMGGTFDWEQAPMPEEPHAGELLACVMPVSRLALADFFIQSSRRGCIKKTMTSMSQTILANRFLGKGTIQKADQSFDIILCNKKDKFALVTYEGRLLGLDVDDLSYTAEDRIKLEVRDYAIASFILRPEETLMCVTQNGKVIQREGSSLEVAKSPATRGQALISPSRLDQGARFIGAAPIRDGDRVMVLDAAGRLTLHLAEDLFRAGAIQSEGLILSIGLIPSQM